MLKAMFEVVAFGVILAAVGFLVIAASVILNP